MRAKFLQSRLTLQLHGLLCPPGSSVHAIFQARRLEWAAISSSRDLPAPGAELDSLSSPALAGGSFTTSATTSETFTSSKQELSKSEQSSSWKELEKQGETKIQVCQEA